MADSFDQIVFQLRRTMNSSKVQISKIPKLSPREQQDYKSEVQEFQGKLDELSTLISQYERNTNKYNLTQNQIQNRKKEFQGLVALKNEIQMILDNPKSSNKQNLMDIPTQPKTFNNTYNQSGTDQKQLQKGYEDLKKDTDKKIDDLNDQVLKTKHVAIQIGQEVDVHNDKLGELDQRIDQNTYAMIKTSDKMSKLIKESSSWCILLTIFIEIAILILIILYM